MINEMMFAEYKYYKCTYDEYVLSHCSNCARYKCPHRNKYGRYPVSMGGLGLCPNLDEYERRKAENEKNN